MKIYLDTCCYGRPRDDQRIVQNAIEAAAVEGVIDICRIGGHMIIGSTMVEIELMDNPNAEGRSADIGFFKKTIGRNVELEGVHFARAREFIKKGVGAKDSVHLAVAEIVGVDALLTVDKRFLRVTAVKNLCGVMVINPLNFILGGAIWRPQP